MVTLRAESAEAAVRAGRRAARADPRTRWSFGTLTLDVDTAVGVAVHPDHGNDPETLLQRADLATNAAKVVPCGVQLFNPALESRSVRRLGLAGDLRRALDNDELEVYFQPKVTLRDRRLVGVECLARWEHPAHGAVAPEDFVAVAEHTGQLRRLTEVVLARGPAPLPGVGRRRPAAVDRGQPLRPHAASTPTSRTGCRSCSSEYGVAPAPADLRDHRSRACSDDIDRPLPTLRRLRDLGVRLSVDDFGTGYSSLSYLRRLPVHEVKVDRSLRAGHGDRLRRPGDRPRGGDLSRQFGLTVVAEGVESELTLDLLRGDRLRDRPGLPVQPAAAVRAAGGLVRRPDRAGTDARPARSAGCARSI